MTTITIRDVPESARDELAAKAAKSGRSLQEYLLRELIRLASRPSLDDHVSQVRRRKQATGTTLSAADILAARDRDRP